QAEDGIRDFHVTGVQTCALPIFEPSVGSVGDSYDNSMAESVIGLYKTELIRNRGPWRNLDTVEFATLEWVDWWNNRRTLEPIGNIPPAEKEANYYHQNTPASTAGLT